MEKKKILVAGATGFIGSHLVKRFLTDGWDVHILIRESSNLKTIEFCKSDIKMHLYDGTIQTMLTIMESVKPMTVFHLASLFIAEHNSNDITPLLRSNIEFGTHLAEAMVKNNVVNLINTGTSWQHYQNEEYNPVCLYAATKQAYEDILRYYTETNTLKLVNLKLFDTYGPNDYRNKLFALLKKAESCEMPLAMSEGNQFIDLVYIDDVIEAFVLAQKFQLYSQKNKIAAFAVSSHNPIRLKDVAELYSEIIGKKLNINWGKRPYRKREVMVPWNKGQAVPDWIPKIDLREGIKKLNELI